MTANLRIMLALALLVIAGCSVKNTSELSHSSPQAPPGVEEAATQNPPLHPENEFDDEADLLPDQDDLSSPAQLSPNERKILDTELSFAVGPDITQNEDVQRYFHYYTHLHRGTFEAWLKRAQVYLPHIRARFQAEGLPEELIYLPFAESGFNPFAYSRAGASGIWQFMPQTGIHYGLRYDAWIDERRDPYKSTEAAIAYLKKLYGDFGDWSLALAAYNAGEGTIGRAMKKTGCEDFFALCDASNDLKDETKNYVPKFLALVKIAKNLEQLGFEPINWNARATSVSTLTVQPRTDLLALSRSVGLDWKEFREINPVFRKQEAPHKGATRVAIPVHLVAKAEEFLKRPVLAKAEPVHAQHTVKQGDTWWGLSKKYNSSVAELQKINKNKSLQLGAVLQIPQKSTKKAAPNPETLHTARKDTQKYAAKRANYVVSQGDTMWSIAKSFKTDVATLAQANGLKSSSRLHVGQALYIPDAGSAATQVAQAKTEAARKKLIQYEIKPGDNLWSIARQFGVTADDLRQWNKLAHNITIKPGDQLQVYQ
ncbi:LysM peptidoglycan-binding domain-containing protein [Desulfovibrionales bacterium]